MKFFTLTVFVFIFIFSSYGQETILYDLDSYRRVDFKFRSTIFNPDVFGQYSDVINDPLQSKNYSFFVSGNYTDFQIVNDAENQKRKRNRFELSVRGGSNRNIMTEYSYSQTNRKYSGNKFFKSRQYLNFDNKYIDNGGVSRQYEQNVNLRYGLGFGFGRVEVINDAWLGARILEELNQNKLLLKIPGLEEMQMFFDKIGELQNERILDSRLRDIEIIEKITEYIQQRGWIEQGSLKAFIILVDTYRYEDFLVRNSGERLEFMLEPNVSVVYRWRNTDNFLSQRLIQPGFGGSIVYDIYKNGDLRYYTIKSLSSEFNYSEAFTLGRNYTDYNFNGSINYYYTYRYLHSLRTIFELGGRAGGRLTKTRNAFNTSLVLLTNASYKYYVSPATQLVLHANVNYNDNAFQIDEYNPNLSASFSVDIVHAFR